VNWAEKLDGTLLITYGSDFLLDRSFNVIYRYIFIIILVWV
jgi:hypothetical protein